jgi:SAM-dependent MidA family methyltransferase
MNETLTERIARHIRMNGPLPLAEYMHWCLFDKTQGYYQNKQVFGHSGDFVTAPEVSQMFGELIGAWLVNTWRELGQPFPFNLIELGPGNGTLMADIVRATNVDQDFVSAMRIQMIETSARLIDIQKEKLEHVKSIQWHVSLDDIADGPALIIANEFLDALPFRQYVKHKDKWHERAIDTDDEGKLIVGMSDNCLPLDALPQNHEDEPDGSVFEISTIREAFVERIASCVTEQNGAALLIDYGHVSSGFGDTFQAIHAPQYTNPFENAGEADLTSHVDFGPFSEIVEKSGSNALPIMTQGDFLLKLGLLERAGSLGADKSAKEQDDIKHAAERLALPDQMGDLFKVFAISSKPELWPFETRE